MNIERLATIREVDNTGSMKDYVLQLILERDALRQEVKRLRAMALPTYQKTQRVRQAHKDTVRHE